MNSEATLRKDEMSTSTRTSAQPRAVFAAAFLMLLCAPVASAMLTGRGQQLGDSLLDSKDEESRSVGNDISLRGERLLIGAPRLQNNEEYASQCYVHDVFSGETLFTLSSPTSPLFDQFGFAVQMGAQLAAVGAPGVSASKDQGGRAYVYDTEAFGLMNALSSPQPELGDKFGHDVAVDASSVVVGAPGDRTNGFLSGAAYLYHTDQQPLVPIILAPGTLNAQDQYGFSVSISGTRAVVGAPGDDTAGNGSGAAYLFDTGSGELITKIVAGDASAGDAFGGEVWITNEYIAIGARGRDEVERDAGAIYIFDAQTGHEIRKITQASPLAGVKLGEKFQMSGTSIIAIHNRIVTPGPPGRVWHYDVSTGKMVTHLRRPTSVFGNTNNTVEAAIDGQLTVMFSRRSSSDPESRGISSPFFTPPYCPGDANGSGTVDLQDLNSIQFGFGFEVDRGYSSDFDANGVIDLNDLNLLLLNFGNQCFEPAY